MRWYTRPHPPAPRATPRLVRKTIAAPEWSSRERARLGARFDLARASLGTPHAGLVVCDLHGRVIYGANAALPLTPASTLKTIVAATSWFTLGPQYRFETKFVGAQPKSGELEGDLGLVGGGDPILTTNDLRGGAAVLWRAGLRHVHGGVIADATRFSGPEQNPAWDPNDLEFGFAAGTSAISIDQNTVEFRITPTTPGAPAGIQLEPRSSSVRVSGGAMTYGYGSYNSLTIERAGEPNTFAVAGGLPPGPTQHYWRSIADVPAYAADVVDRVLADRGIALERDARVTQAPLTGTTLWRHRSPPLGTIVRQMLVESNNHIAETLLRTLGAECCNAGTEHTGAQVERTFLVRRQVPIGGLHIVDGSGLSDRNRVSALTLAKLLAAADAEDLDGSWLRAFALAGKEGTVRHRDLSAAAGRVRAKSGYIEGASGLVGYVNTRNHGRVTFAFIVDDWSGDISHVFATEDALLDALAEF